jgi:ParB-like chromosome segregation protein Spo0J
VKFVEVGGVKYFVDGHHRTQAAKDLGLASIPAESVEPPYLGYQTLQDFFDWER